MSTEIKIDGYAENGEKPWTPQAATDAEIQVAPNPKHRSANVEIKVYWIEDHNDLGQALTALDALDQVYEAARSHLDALRAIAEGSEERLRMRAELVRQEAAQEPTLAQVREALADAVKEVGDDA